MFSQIMKECDEKVSDIRSADPARFRSRALVGGSIKFPAILLLAIIFTLKADHTN